MSEGRSSKTIGLILLAAGVLTFEITLTRIFAIQQFHHFAFVVISLAVMGFSASGVILSLRKNPLPLTLVSIGFATAIGISYLTINYLPFDSYSISLDPKQIWILLLYFTATGAPFLLAGLAIGASLSESGTEAFRPYAANFFGSALGCLVAITSISLIGGETTIVISVVLGLLSAAAFSSNRVIRLALIGTTIILALSSTYLMSRLRINLSPYKPLSIARLFPDAKEALTEWSVSSRLDVIETNSVHVFPGLSLNVIGIPPEQIGFFIDGDGPIPVTKLAPDNPLASDLAVNMPSGLAQVLRPNAEMLILQPGGGLEVLSALASGVDSITIASDEPLILEALQGPYQEYSFGLLEDTRVSISPRTSRGSLATSHTKFDIILFALTDSFRPITSGAFSLTENYILTVESLTQALESLKGDGLLMLSRWLGTPPSESARAWATLLAALAEIGVTDPNSNLIAYRDMRTATMVASLEGFNPEELALTRGFLSQNSYDPIHLPDLQLEELNLYNRLPVDNYYSLFRDLLNDPASTEESYEFNLQPPTDNSPFFYHFFRWSQTPDVLDELGVRWQPFGGSGYLVLLLLLGLMILLALPLGITPLLVVIRRDKVKRPGAGFSLYFGFLGAGYLLIEIPLIQQFTLILDRPANAFAVVLFSMLLSSGLGSLFVKRISLRKMLPILIGYLALLISFSPTIVATSLGWSASLRVLLTFLLISPAGFLMGIPFASGLRQLERIAPGVIPWAWAVNGAISGIAGVLAAMITLDLGLRATMILGALTYVGAYISSSKFK